ncbi:hypothetical protein KZ774_22030 [Escherichia coli]|nr:hypothetical protein [Escherichia coli]
MIFRWFWSVGGGAWAASDSSGVDYSPIAAGFKGLLPYTSKKRLACSDSDALIIEGCLARLKQKKAGRTFASCCPLPIRYL